MTAGRDTWLPFGRRAREKKEYVKLGTFRSTWGAIACNEILNLPSPPTALFVASNAIVPGVMKTLRQSTLRIPDDISLMCFDDLDWFSFSDPPISAVATSHELLAEAAVDLLRHRIEDPSGMDKTPSFLQLSFQLMIRRSTAPPRNESQFVSAQPAGKRGGICYFGCDRTQK